MVLLMAASGSLAADSSNRYFNQTVGFEVSKPDGWRFVTAAQNLENLKRVKFGTVEFKQAVTTYSTAPLVVMMKYEEPYDGLNPSFKANIRPFGALPQRTGQAVLALVVPHLLKQLPDAQITQQPEDTTVDGKPAAHVVISYTLKSEEGGEFPTTSEVWIVPAGDFFFMLGAGYSQNSSAERAEVERVLASIRIDASGD